MAEEDLNTNPYVSSGPVHLVPNKSDSDISDELKKEIITKLKEVCITMNKAKGLNFEIEFQLGSNYEGKWDLAKLRIMKLY